MMWYRELHLLRKQNIEYLKTIIEMDRQMRCLRRDLKDARALHRNYRTNRRRSLGIQ